jgi:hypothetical protein
MATFFVRELEREGSRSGFFGTGEVADGSAE